MSTTETLTKMNDTKYPDDLGGISTVVNRGTTRDDQDLLVQLNSEEIQRLVPLIVYLLLISIIGIPGNSLVYHVYRTLYKGTNSRYFILCLSAIDLFTCLFVVPFELFIVFNQYTYRAVVACKLTRFFNSAPTVTNAFMFILIAVDRYRKVCKPHGWQIKQRMAKLLCIAMIVSGVLVSWPTFIIYGKKTFPVPHRNLNATECATDDSMKGTIYPFIYGSILCFLVILCITSLVVIYVIIGRAIRRHSKDLANFQSSRKMKKLRKDNQNNDPNLSSTVVESEWSSNINNDNATTSSCIGDTTDVFEDKDGEGDMLESTICDRSDVIHDDNEERDIPESITTILDRSTLTNNVPERSLSFETGKKEGSTIYKKSPKCNAAKTNDNARNSSSPKLSSVRNRQTPASSSRMNSNGPKPAHNSASHNRKQQLARKMSFLMFLITLACILSYLPLLSLMLIRGINKEFVASMSDEARGIYKFFLCSHFFNSVVNPFIYGLCDRRFRNGVRRLIRC